MNFQGKKDSEFLNIPIINHNAKKIHNLTTGILYRILRRSGAEQERFIKAPD